MAFSRADMLHLFNRLNEALADQDTAGELHLVGGAVMCLVYEARQSTKDIDGFFRPAKIIREAARHIALSNDLDESWLNDAVKGYASDSGDFNPFLELSNLRIMAATPEYLLAMKCLAMRLGEEFHDEADVRYLLRYLNLSRYDQAVEVISRYYPLAKVPQKTLYALEELLPDQPS